MEDRSIGCGELRIAGLFKALIDLRTLVLVAVLRVIFDTSLAPQTVQRTPLGQRRFSRYAKHISSVAKAFGTSIKYS